MHYFCLKGIDQVITMDLHSKEIQGFFNCPVDNLRASPFLIQYIQDKVYTNSPASKFSSLICPFLLKFYRVNKTKTNGPRLKGHCEGHCEGHCSLGIRMVILAKRLFNDDWWICSIHWKIHLIEINHSVLTLWGILSRKGSPSYKPSIHT